jgi:hypothetical protein
MKRTHHSKDAHLLSETVHRQLTSYGLIATATGVGILALALPVDAEIVYTPAHVVIGGRERFTLDVNHDGIPDFILSNRNFCTTDICGRTLRALPAQANNKIVGMKGIFVVDYASALKRGSQIGSSRQFLGKLMAASGTEYGTGGQWLNVTNRYLGLKFTVSGQVHFGWARLNVVAGSGKITVELTGFAYETVAGRSIIAGQTKGQLETGSNGRGDRLDFADQVMRLGLLAQGAAGLDAWRRPQDFSLGA